MAETVSALQKPALGATERKDLWWLGPLLTVTGFTLGFGYLTVAAFFFDPDKGKWGPYLSPVYSPPVQEWFPFIQRWIPKWLSPAALILWAPGGFRATCYYYRKAYYRSVFSMPPACAVGGLPINYKGEKGLLILQNIHRYFMYLALLFVFIFLPIDVVKSFIFAKPDGSGAVFGMGLGSLVLTLNWLLISGYTLGCHSFRHLAGGKLDCFSCSASAQFRYGIWKKSTILNEKHMQWAWCSLATVGLTDLYIRLVANGVLHDPRFF